MEDVLPSMCQSMSRIGPGLWKLLEIRVPPPKDKFWMLLSMLKVKQIYLLQSFQTTDDQV